MLISGSHRVNQTSSEASGSLKREEKLKQTIERKEYMQHGKLLRRRSSVLSKNQALIFPFLIETQEGVGHHHFGDQIGAVNFSVLCETGDDNVYYFPLSKKFVFHIDPTFLGDKLRFIYCSILSVVSSECLWYYVFSHA